jgi:AcrR family transcriptional regulator
MTNTRRQVVLLEKNKPQQERAKRTYDSILAAAAELLVEVGVERISTNLIAERAGITVPALYRYFPNKYAVLNALGAKLMDSQNKVAEAWFRDHVAEGNPLQWLADIQILLKQTYTSTLEQVAGLAIIQALRAVAPLQELRIESHRVVAVQFLDALVELLGEDYRASLEVPTRMTIDMGYSVVEMALEDNYIDPDDVLLHGAKFIESYWLDVVAGLDIDIS